jgi:hypothetical protein
LPLELNGFVPLLQEWIPSTVVKAVEHYLGHCAIHQHHWIDPWVSHPQKEKTPQGIWSVVEMLEMHLFVLRKVLLKYLGSLVLSQLCASNASLLQLDRDPKGRMKDLKVKVV